MATKHKVAEVIQKIDDLCVAMKNGHTRKHKKDTLERLLNRLSFDHFNQQTVTAESSFGGSSSNGPCFVVLVLVGVGFGLVATLLTYTSFLKHSAKQVKQQLTTNNLQQTTYN